jgi:opacity protein-like surface antigen
MRKVLTSVLAIALSVGVARVTEAQTKGTAQGFGGLSVNQAAEPLPSLGGTVTVALAEHVHVIGEVGRLGNVAPPLAGNLLAVPGIHVSALYGEGGLRALAGGSNSVLRPYVEGTFGVSRLNVSSTLLPSWGNALVTAGTSFLDRNSPTVGVGGGVLFQAGPVVFDAGYRYKQLLDTTTLGTVLGLGQGLRSSDVRFGVGFRF